MTAEQPSYAFGNARAIQRDRLRLLATLLDEGTFRLLNGRGVKAGWRCLEVGAGGGSVAAWLCQQVAPGGSVLATDLDTTVLRELDHPSLAVRVHDVLRDDLPAGEFDLVHARLLLAWLPEPDAGLRRMVAALKPGGCLIIEEMDFGSLAPDPGLDRRIQAMFARVIDAHNAVLAQHHAFDPYCGRRIAGNLSKVGLSNVGCEGRAWTWRGGQPGGRVWQLTFMQLRDQMVTSGLVPAGEVDAVIELCEDPKLRFTSQITMAAWGQRPA